jgi:23S rRNA (pseudouridine1915-N3)-methyltransferase
MKIKILAVGKLKEKAYQNRIDEYVKWINRDIQVEIIFLKDNDKVNKKLLAHINTKDRTICLSEEGEKRSSKEFSKLLFSEELDHTFILGGPDGLPRYIKEKANQIFSLSELTFPHEMALLILAEQLYRAVSIEKGKNYHR